MIVSRVKRYLIRVGAVLGLVAAFLFERRWRKKAQDRADEAEAVAEVAAEVNEATAKALAEENRVAAEPVDTEKRDYFEDGKL